MPDSNLVHPLSDGIVLLRLSGAVLVGAIVGWERQTHHKPAGLRTHMLVSLGAALLVITSIQMGMLRAEADGLSRVMQGIVTGIGFLGAGEIINLHQADMQETKQIRGLTSAAAIWVSAALGVAIGCGLWVEGIFSAFVTLVILWGVKKIER